MSIERFVVAGLMGKFLQVSVLAMVMPCVAFGAQAQNPRNNANNARNTARVQEFENNAAIRRSATSVIARTTAVNNRKNRPVVTARNASVGSASVRSTRPVVSNNGKSRAAAKTSVVRSGTAPVIRNNSGLSRAAKSRATAVFNDITKIGGGYSNCRDSYATCMDQFCANANETYRRCYCSDRFTSFRDTADNLDRALQLLADFQDNNLNAVDKSAAEVNAMYTASEGEKAIKRDTSASQKLLDSIGDVLSGKKTPEKQKASTSLGMLDLSGFSFSSNDDIWGGSSSIFSGSGTNTDMADLEGKELFDSAAKQCSEITRDACGSDAMFNLARSAYSIMITQDCNAYEKNINAKKASVEETVRTAEKYLREARLEEYRSHNSADVNECLDKVEKAMKEPVACGSNFEKCLDYSGLYINTATGEPIYSQALFGLNSLIVLDGSADVLAKNPKFDEFLEKRKMFATTALDSCRDLSETVWSEFKRSALIQIAQAQDAKIEQIKDSCVVTIKECYDTQTGAMKELDTTKTSSTDAIAAVTARGMCYDKVQACAALYGDPDGCVYDDATKKLTPAAGKKCGLQSLLAFVDTVDSVKVAEGCEAALTKYAKEICPDNKELASDGETEIVIPYGKCVKADSVISKNELRAALDARRKIFCAQDLVKDDKSNTLQETNAFNTDMLNNMVKQIYDALGIAFTSGCEDEGGTWYDPDVVSDLVIESLQQSFYVKYYGKAVTSMDVVRGLNLPEMGYCVSSDLSDRCKMQNPKDGETGAYTSDYAEYDMATNECKFKDAWFKDRCVGVLGGTWNGDVCHIDNITKDGLSEGYEEYSYENVEQTVVEPVKEEIAAIAKYKEDAIASYREENAKKKTSITESLLDKNKLNISIKEFDKIKSQEKLKGTSKILNVLK